MAFNPNGSKGPVSDINVTPLVDVMLVLLVIFMITAPLLLNGIKLDLPKTRETNKMQMSSTQVVLSVDSRANLFLMERKISFDNLKSEILSAFKEHSADTLYFRADKTLSYGKVAKIISYLKSVGVLNIALITQLDKE